MNLNFIPQVFYDLIARLIPGSILIWSSYIVYFGTSICIEHFKKIMNKTWEINFLLFIMILLVAYIISIILSGLCSFISKLKSFLKTIFEKKVDKKDNFYDNLKNNTIIAENALKIQSKQNIEFPGTVFIYDYIRFKRPDIGARFVKLRAELRMSKVLGLGWMILFILNILKVPFDSIIELDTIKEFLIIECIIGIGLIGILIFYNRLNTKYTLGLNNYWILLHIE
jgi:hypothetical protein